MFSTTTSSYRRLCIYFFFSQCLIGSFHPFKYLKGHFTQISNAVFPPHFYLHSHAFIFSRICWDFEIFSAETCATAKLRWTWCEWNLFVLLKAEEKKNYIWKNQQQFVFPETMPLFLFNFQCAYFKPECKQQKYVGGKKADGWWGKAGISPKKEDAIKADENRHFLDVAGRVSASFMADKVFMSFKIKQSRLHPCSSCSKAFIS